MPQEKPPVVTIMGHVDHGKTSLLDYIRKTNVASREFGQITQAIGSYQIVHQGRKVTFIDTPGHEAFSQMRSRGAHVADLVVLVVSASDGVMPQTKESIKLLKQTQIPFIVAINKIDLPEASPDKVKGQLAENEVLVEEYGGNIVCIPISAKTGQGVDQLLEMIILSTDMADLKADPDGCFYGEVVEAKADKFSGLMVTVIVKQGTLRKGDLLVVSGITGKAKMIRDWRGQPVNTALPGDPVVIIGLEKLPPVGSLISKPGEAIDGIACEAVFSPRSNAVEVENKIKIILRTDVLGSLEAITCCLPPEVAIISEAVGEINEADVTQAKSYGAEIITFNLNCPSSVHKLAEIEEVKITNYKIIYDLFKYLEERVLKMLEPTIDKKVMGKAEIKAVFDIKGETVLGCRVIEGKINRTNPVCVQRDNKVLLEAKPKSLKEGKQDINEALTGQEFGITLSKTVDFLAGDMLISYSLEQ